MKKSFTPLVLGGHGMVGSAIIRELKNQGHAKIFASCRKPTPDANGVKWLHGDLTNWKNTDFIIGRARTELPTVVFNAAGKVGGILANQNYIADFATENLLIGTNVVKACYKHRIPKLINLGSSCIYPKDLTNDIPETALLTGPLEPTNAGYAIAKLAVAQLCTFYNKQYGTNFYTVMPCNLYGPNDTFHKLDSHVIPALILKFHNAKVQNERTVELWGDGNTYREFLYVEDLARILYYLAEKIDAKDCNGYLNIGVEKDTKIADLAETIRSVVGYNGQILWDASKPKGFARRKLNTELAKSLGCPAATTNLSTGISKTYEWYKI